MNPPETRRFSARRSEFGAVRSFIESACENLAHADRQRLVLIVEELFCNSIEHGYRGDSAQSVWLTLAPAAAGWSLTYEDAAPAFDPFAGATDSAFGMSTENRPIGGLGVFLIEHLCSSARYERRADRNVIELFVALNRPAAKTDSP